MLLIKVGNTNNRGMNSYVYSDLKFAGEPCVVKVDGGLERDS